MTLWKKEGLGSFTNFPFKLSFTRTLLRLQQSFTRASPGFQLSFTRPSSGQRLTIFCFPFPLNFYCSKMTAFIHFEFKSCRKFAGKLFWGMIAGLCLGNLVLLSPGTSGVRTETNRFIFLETVLWADDAFSLAPPPMDFDVQDTKDSKEAKAPKDTKSAESAEKKAKTADRNDEKQEQDEDFLLPPPLDVPTSKEAPQTLQTLPSAAEQSKSSPNAANKERNQTANRETPSPIQPAKSVQMPHQAPSLHTEAPEMDFGEEESKNRNTPSNAAPPASELSKLKKNVDFGNSRLEDSEMDDSESADLTLDEPVSNDLDTPASKDLDSDDFLSIKDSDISSKADQPARHSPNAAENFEDSFENSFEDSSLKRTKESPQSQEKNASDESNQTYLKSDSDVDFSFLEIDEEETEESKLSAKADNSTNPDVSPKPASLSSKSDSLNSDTSSEKKSTHSSKKGTASIPEITPEETALREKILTTLRIYDQISLCTEENRPIDVISYIIPYGCDAEIFFGPREENKKINAIGALCWNIPMGEESAFSNSKEKLVPRLGYGIQQYSGQLLAALAIARVPIDYRFPAAWASLDTENPENGKNEENEENADEANSKEKENLNQQDNSNRDSSQTSSIPRGKKHFDVQDLVEFEKKNCRWEKDLSQTLIALSYYLPPDAEWVAGDGETWTLERIVQNELERPFELGEAASANQLLGLLCAIRCWQMHTNHAPLTDSGEKANAYLQRFQKFVLEIQNDIGVWHPEFFKKKGVTPNQPTEMLLASGHILRWLVTITPRSELNDPRIFKAVTTLNELLEYQLTYWDPSNASGTEIEGIMAALHALTIYEKRRFKKAARKRQ